MLNPKVVLLEDAEYLEVAPTWWSPRTGDERLAALCGYLTGDGSIASKIPKYRKKDGTLSVYGKTFSGAFYSNDREDLELIADDLTRLGISASKIGIKKTLQEHRVDGYQIQIAQNACKEFIDCGVPSGKKTTIEFDVPDWILSGDLGVQRAYISALFGAEGSAPCKDKSTKGRMPRNIVLSMCKIEPCVADKYFTSLVKILKNLKVNAHYRIDRANRFNKPYLTYVLTIKGESVLSFLENVGYTYCVRKSLLAWQWAKYINAYNTFAKDRREWVVAAREGGMGFLEIGQKFGISRNGALLLYQSIKKNTYKTFRAGHNFPHFSEWIKERWIEEKRTLKVNILSKTERKEKESVFNVLVDSPDHSYLLANGVNNFNSFLTMSGRVYHGFDRNIHIRKREFNPSLPIWIGQDFNIDPMSSVIVQPQEDGTIHVVDEIVLRGSNTEEVCNEIERKYWRDSKKIILFPDPAGQYRQHARGESDLDIFREKGIRNQRFHRKHPPVADRVNAVNRMLKSADGRVRLYVDPKCKHLIKSLEQTLYKPGGRDIDKDADVEHSADALGYLVQYQYPVRKIEIAGVSI
jgi:hypothetical protein